mmetsp:Transcript_14162/g.36692  ORF Transcript_14162/g.36692 Transcript_14162/m.36692 type:complete len:567 (+) Transcript_14162:1-1701(+)
MAPFNSLPTSSQLLVPLAVGAAAAGVAAVALYGSGGSLGAALARSLDRRPAPVLFEELAEQLRDMAALEGCSGLLGWDEMVMMPPEAASARGKQKAALAGVLHDKSTSPALGRLLALLDKADCSELNKYQRATIRIAARDFKRKASVTKRLAQRIAELETEAMQAWVEARKESDFGKFAPFLEEWVAVSREKARMIDPSRPAYDVLLEEFEPGMTSARIDAIFEELKAGLVPLLKELRSGTRPDASFLSSPVSVDKQAEISRELAELLGFDTSKGRVDVSVHPFTGGTHPTDVRITTRYKEEDMREGMMATIHETGHALYEQGRNLEYDGLPVNRAAGMGIHESQSLLWERMVALGEPFSRYLHPKLAATFPAMLEGRSQADLYAAMNVMNEKSMIRVESDEITYPLHIILRYELEKGLIEGSIEVKDLPKLWNEKMAEYLGCEPASDAEGVLQDVHWSAGAFGYFPTYSLGAMAACQIYKEAARCLPSLQDDIAAGNFEPLKTWLNQNIHEVGSLYATGDDLLKAVTGSKLDPQVYLNHLTSKYSVAYGLCSAEQGEAGCVFHFN